MIRKISKGLSLIMFCFTLYALSDFNFNRMLEPERIYKSLFWCIPLLLIWFEFKVGSLMLDFILIFPFFSFTNKQLGEGTVRLLNIIFHGVGWFMFLVPFVAFLILKFLYFQ